MNKIAVVFAIVISAFIAMAEEATAGPKELEAVVMVSRHGIRSPTQSTKDLQAYTKQIWPDFGVSDGYLTPHGKKAAKKMGKFYGEQFRSGGMLPANGCPHPKQILLRADNAQRTIVTAQALSKGIFPKCNYKVRVTPGYDPLIRPQDANVCTEDSKEQNDAIMAMIGGSWKSMVTADSHSIQTVQKTLKWNAPGICTQYKLPANCKLLDLPANAISNGPLGYTSTVGEIFLMEYATGMPLKNVAWGRNNTPHEISFMNKVHAAYFSVSNSNAYTAGRAGSNMAHWILKRLNRAAAGRGSKLSVIVAHDNNLLNIAGLLNADWLLQGYQKNQVPPGGAIAFELWRDSNNDKLSVSVVFRAQTLPQLRGAKKLSGSNQPASANLTNDVCGSQTVDGMCPFKKFRKIISSAIVPACVGKGKPAGQ